MKKYQKIIEQYQTPFFIYDIEVLHERIKNIKNKLSNMENLVYAVKANTFIVPYIDHLVNGYEICSKGEFEICNKLNINRNKMVISGVYKDEETIENMIKTYPDIGVYTVESLTQWNLLNKLTQKYNKKINILIRLTSGNQFGINEQDFKKILKSKNNLIETKGIEYFSGTQKHSLKKIEKEVNYLIEFINNIEKEYNINIKEIEYGPGLPVYYFEDETFDEDTFLSEVNKILSKIKNKKISLELGRSIAASCGSYITKIVDMKTNKNGNFCIVDGGINHLVYYGGMMGMKVPHLEIIKKEQKEETNTYNIYGSLCTINDVLIKNYKTSELNIGDTLIFKNAGAYSATEGIALFLSRDLPKIIIKTKEKNKIVRDSLKTSDINYPNYK